MLLFLLLYGCWSKVSVYRQWWIYLEINDLSS